MERKAKLLSPLLIAAMVISLVAGAVAVVVTTQPVFAQDPDLEVVITAPANLADVDVCQNFEVRATITNNGTVTATDVTANISYDGATVEWVAGDGATPPHEQDLGDLDEDCSVEVMWTLHCRNAGVTPITVTADAANAEPASDQISVFQTIKVQIIQPDPDCAGFEACPSQEFTLRATVTNTGDMPLTLNGTAVAIVDGPNFTAGAPSPNPANATFEPGQSRTYTWGVHCDALGDDIIKVEVYNDQDVLIGYDEYAFHQRGLLVDIVMPEPDKVFCASNDFYVNAVITNTCDDTIEDVRAMVGWEGPVELGQGETSNTTFVGEIVGKTSADVWWELHCTGPGEALVWVVANGTTVFGEEVMDCDSVVVWQDILLQVEINSPLGTETYCASQHFDLTFTIHNRGEVVALDVAATIDPGATAEVDGLGEGVSWTTPVLGDIPGGQTIGPFTYDMHCTGTGDSTITVDATADNLIDEQIGGDSVTVTQAAEEVTLKVEIVNPMTSDEFCTHCYNEFTVEAILSNPACALVEYAFAELQYSCGPGDVTILSPRTQGPFNIGGLSTITVSWDVVCTGEGDVTFWVEAWAQDVDPVLSINNVTIHQKEFIVEITDVGGIDLAPVTLSTCQDFTITARFINCHETTQLVNIQAILDYSDVGAVPVPGSMVNIEYCNITATCNETEMCVTDEEDIPVEDTLLDVPPYRSRVILERICPCCCAEVTWTLQCVSAISGELTVTALTSGGVFLDEDSVSINQQWKAHLVARLDSFPGTISEPIAEDTFITTSADAIAACQDFSVVAIVTNIGEATAANVEVTIDVAGNASPSGTLTQTVDANIPGVALGTIPGGQSGKAMWELRCDGLGEVWIEIVELTGMDANTSNPILLENIEICMARSVSQVEADFAEAESTDAGGIGKDVYGVGDDVYVTGCGFQPNTYVDVYIVGDLAWNDGDPIPTDVGDGMDTLTTDGSGNLGPVIVWQAPLTLGEYDIVFDADQDGVYHTIGDCVDHPDHPGFTVRLPIEVGGEVYAVNKLAILAPWIALFAATIAAATVILVILMRRRAHS